MKQKFDPKKYTGKKIIYRKFSKFPGISVIFDWDESKKKYRQRESGNKYYAFKREKRGSKTTQVSRCFATFNDARLWRESAGVDVGVQDHLQFEELVELCFQYLRGIVRPSTFETYKKELKHLSFFKNLFVSEINAASVDEWLRKVKEPNYLAFQHKTRLSYRHELALLSRILNFYSEYKNDSYSNPIKKRHYKDCIIDKTRFLREKALRKGRTISHADAQKFLAFLKERGAENADWKVFYYLALFQLNTGTRIGEACALRWEDIDLENGVAQICRTVFWRRGAGKPPAISELPKGGSFREIPLLDDLIEALKTWRDEKGTESGLIFSGNPFSPLKYRSIQNKYNIAFKALGLPYRSTHVLRSSFATDFLLRTKNLNGLKAILGHAHVSETEKYAKTTPEVVHKSMSDYQTALQSQSNVVNLEKFRPTN